MSTFLAVQVPTGVGELIKVETLPLQVEASPEFEEAKQLLAQMLSSAKTLANSINTKEDYERGVKMMSALKVFLKNVEEGIDPAKRLINSAKDKLMEMQHELDVPAKQLHLELSRETARYKLAEEEKVRQENERLAREAEIERQRLQRLEDIKTLQNEIRIAKGEADGANGRSQVETANEINNNLAQIVASLEVPESIKNPLETCTRVRQIVALALQHEDARIAAAAAKAEGDKRRAAEILKASKKLEAPQVEEVQQTRVEVTPAIQRGPDLHYARGSSTKQIWRVKRQDIGGGKEKVVGIIDPQRVCREHPEYCEPSVTLLDEYAKRSKERPNIPGVIWELSTKTIGVR
ncbi:MAG TPA: hypothetical protein VMW38_24995 [Terriglobia bacterium]|nr:hypothetical protein [Terriglobia bacterium]